MAGVAAVSILARRRATARRTELPGHRPAVGPTARRRGTRPPLGPSRAAGAPGRRRTHRAPLGHRAAVGPAAHRTRWAVSLLLRSGSDADG